MEPDVNSSKAMDVIDKLRSLVPLHQIDFPQLVACGDQSCGKSSVLEAICGMRFPVHEGLCTRHPTEFVMRRGDEWQLTATMRPAADQGSEHVRRLQAYKRETLPYNVLHVDICHAFGDAMKDANQLMGLRRGTRTFARDVLCIKLTGPSLTPLTLVDLPGLFHSRSKDQTVADSHDVKSLVLDYMKQTRTINLVILSASLDLSNQVVTEFVDTVDPRGQRSLGVITKPDTIRSPNKMREYHELLAGAVIPYRLGWHVLMNRGHDRQDTTKAERDQAEAEFLAQGDWKGISAEQKGIKSLLERLNAILDGAITAALPEVLNECETLIMGVRAELEQLNKPSGSYNREREELFDISEKFTSKMSSALKGNYDDVIYMDELESQCQHQQLLTVVEGLIDQFQDELRHNGHAFRILDDLLTPDDADDPKSISRNEFTSRVAQRRKALGGAPGQLNRHLVWELFYEQSADWPKMVDDLVGSLLGAIGKCCTAILEAVVAEPLRQRIADLIMAPVLEGLQQSLLVYVKDVMASQQRREILNIPKSVMDHVPRGRNRETVRVLQEVLESHSRQNNRLPRGSLDNAALNLFTRQFEQRLDINRSDSSEAIECMEAIYRVLPAMLNLFARD